MEPIFIRHQSPAWLNSEGLDKRFIEAAFDEGVRYRAPGDPLAGFPVWDVAELFTEGA